MRWLLRLWWHTCAVCGERFRRHQGGAYTRDVVCSEECWQKAFQALTGRADVDDVDD